MYDDNKGDNQAAGGAGAGLEGGGELRARVAGAAKRREIRNKDTKTTTKSYQITFPVSQPYSCIVRRNIELTSLSLQRGQAALLLAYVFFQQGGGRGLG